MLLTILSLLPGLYFVSGLKAEPVESDRLVDGGHPQPPHAVWIHAYARSGSSTLLSMFSEAWPGAHTGRGSVFALFEPCHKDDVYEPSLAKRGCGLLLSQLATCDFTDVLVLHGWNKSHSRTRGVTVFEPKAAQTACSRADLLAFKTISHPYERFMMPIHAPMVLKKNPNLKLIEVMRDPRSIYTSMLTTPPFSATTKRDVRLLKEICNSFAASLKVRHPQKIRILFEHLVARPEQEMQRAYEFVGADFGDSQLAWINSTFKQGCSDSNKPDGWKYHNSYTDCHGNPQETLLKWKTFMNQDEIDTWSHHRTCVDISKTFNFDGFDGMAEHHKRSEVREMFLNASQQVRMTTWWKPGSQTGIQ